MTRYVFSLLMILLLSLLALTPAINNGIARVPLMGWSSWYGYTSNINDKLIENISDALVSSGLSRYGFSVVAIDDGWAFNRTATGEITADPVLFPNGMAAVADYVTKTRNLTFGIYSDRGDLTCLKRPGGFGYEAQDAITYASWNVDVVKIDSCYGSRSPDIDYAIWRDALNNTGRHMALIVCNPPFGSGEFGHQWRTGPDLYSANYEMVLNRFQLATLESQRVYVGPGAIADPDNLEVGYSPRFHPTDPGALSILEQQTMFTLWAALPAPLLLSADITSITQYPEVMAIITNEAVIAVNQDVLVNPLTPIIGDATTLTSVWSRQLSTGSTAVVLFNAAAPVNATIGFSFSQVGVNGAVNGNGNTTFAVTDLWTNVTIEVYGNGYALLVLPHEAKLLTIVMIAG